MIRVPSSPVPPDGAKAVCNIDVTLKADVRVQRNPLARPRKTVRADDGQEVHGLSFTFDRKSDKDRYYVTGCKPHRWLGYDKTEAIRRFYSIKARETGEQIAVGPGSDLIERLADGVKSGVVKPLLVTPAFFQAFRDLGGRFV